MVKKDLPSLNLVKRHYNIRFNNYAILLFHPVTTLNNSEIHFQCKQLFGALKPQKKILLLFILTMMTIQKL